MAGCGGIHTGKQHVFKILYVYLAFVTRYRHEVFAARHLERMEGITRDVCADFGAELREFNGVSSRRLRQKFPDLRSNTSGCRARGWARASPAST